MFAFMKSAPIHLAVLLTLMVPLNTAGLHIDERRLARAATALRHQMEQQQQDQLQYPPPLYAPIDVLDDGLTNIDYAKRADPLSIINPPESVLSNPAALRDYLRQVNEYFAIIGRPSHMPPIFAQ
ncbi:Neuropeptide F [Echinococcus granulosus]|uniref:Neuropeptide F n=1 Tax=Echinococcus granulosus TaxID=6210 RepID=W6UP81_ECHGR|nr:Neuropeptide F [Echinococcus granulosus]EUB60087.1 Neuropeptide F [Echinococcus granulosus]